MIAFADDDRFLTLKDPNSLEGDSDLKLAILGVFENADSSVFTHEWRVEAWVQDDGLFTKYRFDPGCGVFCPSTGMLQDRFLNRALHYCFGISVLGFL